ASETIRVLVALDDDAQREALATQLAEFDDVVVVERAKDMRPALHDVQRSRLDLVFLDRAMLTAREMRRVREMLAHGTPLIAFVMTHPQLVDAFEPNAVDYLPIPASSQRTRTSIDRAKERLDVHTPFPTWSRTECNGNSSRTRLQAPTQF